MAPGFQAYTLKIGFEREKEIQGIIKRYCFCGGRAVSEMAVIFRFLYFYPQEGAPDIWCLLASEGPSGILGEQTARLPETNPQRFVSFPGRSQSQNDSESRGG